MRIPTVVSSAVALALFPLLGGCTAPPDTGDAASPTASASGATATTPDDDGSCGVLDAETITELAGGPMTEHQETAVGAVPACQWQNGDMKVQVIQAPAVEWAVALPAVLEEIKQAPGLGEENLARIDEGIELIESGAVDPAAACDMFSVMSELSGSEPGTDRVVNLLPDGQAPQAISGQACVDGVYSSVLLVAPGLSKESEKVSTIGVALNRLVAAGI